MVCSRWALCQQTQRTRCKHLYTSSCICFVSHTQQQHEACVLFDTSVLTQEDEVEHEQACPFAQTTSTHCDTLPCSTSLVTPSDLTPPLFAVHLCTSRRTVVESAPSGVVVLQPCVSSCPGESPLWVCRCHRFDSSFRGLLLSLLKLVKMLPFSAQSTYWL